MKTHDLYSQTTARILAELEAGTPPWTRPWRNGPATGVMPHNIGGRPYSSSNILLLWAAKEANGYPTSVWLTFHQALERGGSVRRGEKGTHVIFSKTLAVREDDEEKKVRMARAYCVWNLAQCDGVEAPQAPQKRPERPETAADRFIKAPGVPIRRGGNMAMYVPSQDFIALPEETLFETIEHHHSTALHELVHATGHPSRLNRNLNNRFGNEAYAAEELIAELGSAFLCAHLGITGELRHAAYCQNWARMLRADNRAIFTAASQASRAADFLRGFSQAVEEAAMLDLPKPVFALEMWTVERRRAGWFYRRTYASEKDAWKGPYGSKASVTLMLARQLLKEIDRRERRFSGK